MRKTKIVCTIGPACNNAKTIEEMIANGMNVARLNFSHGTHDYHKKLIDLVKSTRNKLNVPIAIMLDTKGPEIRVKKFTNDFVIINDGDDFTLTTREIDGNENEVAITYKELPLQLKKDDIVLIDDGFIKLKVIESVGTEIKCKVIHGGRLSNNKSINIPNIHLDFPYLSEQDKKDILFGIENDVEFIAASFVRNKDDVINLRKFMNYNGGHNVQIISKIENTEGIDNFDDILNLSDGIMIARGDMGVEVEFERLPGLQKKFISKCYQSGKMVITATQMLDSMIINPNPTRAEITDVANAVFDGTSAVMLSGETAAGKYPVKSVKVMSKIARQAEFDAFEMNLYKNIAYELDNHDTTNAVCDAACTTARDIRAKAIIALTKYGQTARKMSKFRPKQPIVAVTPVIKTYNQLSLSWGVYPVLAISQKTTDELFLHAIDCAKEIDMVSDGDIVVITAGIPLDTSGSTNLIKVEVVGKKL